MNDRPVDRRRSPERTPARPTSGKPNGRASGKPPLVVSPTTLWEYPSQHYASPTGITEQGDRDYVGATPSWVIWQVLTRFTRPGDTVVDPMCGSGTTLDVCRDLGRTGAGFDLAPSRDDIRQADARQLPLPDASADLVFIDPPYSTHVDYSDDPRCIGKLDAGGDDKGRAYYEAMDRVFDEADRVLRPDRVLALFVSDSYRKGSGHHERCARGQFMPIGFDLFRSMRRRFAPLDIVSVVRHSRKLDQGNWRKAAEEENFFLRGFSYLFLMRKPMPRYAAPDRDRGDARADARTPRPSGRTERPTSRPYERSDRAGKPTSRPYERSDRAGKPASRPYERNDRAGKPAPRPYERNDRAGKPAPRPYERSDRAGKPAPRPYERSDRGGKPAPRPYERSDRAGNPAPRPYERSDRGGKPASRPYERNDRAGKPVSRPYERSDRAGKPASRPYERSDRAGTPASRPYERNDRAGKPASRPYERNDRAGKPAPRPYERSDRGGKPTRGPARPHVEPTLPPGVTPDMPPSNRTGRVKPGTRNPRRKPKDQRSGDE